MAVSRSRLAVWLTLVVGCCHGSAFLCAQTGASKAASGSPATSLATGPYYALVIGNNNYKYLKKLQTAVNDANAVAQVLRERYGFQTKVLLDADRQQILNAMVGYRRTLPENSSLLIYYAGHGHHDRDTDESYWLPIDAQNDSNANWISADDITRDVRAISSAHVLVISDSCYSGYLAREADAAIDPAERGAYLAKMLKSKSRTLMASGGDEPVADGGAPGHSVFGATIVESLNRVTESSFTAADLFLRYIQPAVAGRSEQLPQYSVIRNSGHAYGDFVFSRQLAVHSSTHDIPPPQAPSEIKVTAQPVEPPVTSSSTTVVFSAPSLKPPKGSNLAIIVFQDLECPQCARVAPLLHQAARNYNLPLVQYDFPLRQHPWSYDAAVNARYFDSQSPSLGDEYRLHIFQNQPSITKQNLRPMTERWALDHNVSLPDAIDPSGSLGALVNADRQLGERIALDHTPTIFIVRDSGHGPTEIKDIGQLDQKLDEAVKETNSKSKGN